VLFVPEDPAAEFPDDPSQRELISEGAARIEIGFARRRVSKRGTRDASDRSEQEALACGEELFEIIVFECAWSS
jgi:hypothetical protein